MRRVPLASEEKFEMRHALRMGLRAPASRGPAAGAAGIRGGLPLCLGLLLAFTIAGCGGDGGGAKTPLQPGGDTAASLTAAGWTAFEAADLAAALASFDAAIARDATHGPAYVGQGWCRLGLAGAPVNMGTALASFDGAVQRQQSGPETQGGRAAALLGQGGTANLQAAADAARAARQGSPSFVFGHKTSFRADDLALIEAFALAGRADFAGALAAANAVEASGIQEGDPNTWSAGGTLYGSFEGAVLGFLHKLSAERAG